MALSTQLKKLSRKIAKKSATVGVFGVGYVGLPLACAFATAGYRTIAADNDRGKIQAIREGMSYVEDDYVRKVLPKLVSRKMIDARDGLSEAASASDISIIAVPTPLGANQEPDLSYVANVAESIAEGLQPGKLVILESSVYPGTTDLIVRPILERGGLMVGRDIALAHSPERIDYNNRKFGILNTPKVVGGVTPSCTRLAAALYEKILQAPVITVTNSASAEASKMLENTYRYVNIALVNELSGLFEKLGLDAWEVIAAASTKPFGFQPFYPGPGVGGHCIPKDPHYLAFRAQQVGVPLHLVELSAQINDSMAGLIVARLDQFLRSHGRTLAGSTAALLGLAFKANISDWRRSPSITLAEKLADSGAEVHAYDPFIRRVTVKGGILSSTRAWTEAIRGADILVLATAHSAFRKIKLSVVAKQMRAGAVVVDTRGFWTHWECKKVGLEYLGLGRP